MNITEKTIKAYEEYKGANKGKWKLFNRETAKSISSTLYNTEEEASAAIPEELRIYLANQAYLRKQHEETQRKAEQERIDHEAAHSETVETRRYRTTPDGGRIYYDMPGAVHYDTNGNGNYSTQIWDFA